MNVFLYDLLKKIRGWAWWIVGFGGIILIGGIGAEEEETLFDRFISTLNDEPLSEDIIGSGIFFIVLGLIWRPACNFIMTSLEKTLTEPDLSRLGFKTNSDNGCAPCQLPLYVATGMAKQEFIRDIPSIILTGRCGR